MMELLAISCLGIAVILDVSSHVYQIKKTKRDGKSSQISVKSLLLRSTKCAFTLIPLAIYANWVGFGMQVISLTACCVAVIVVIRYKPKGWRFFKK